MIKRILFFPLLFWMTGGVFAQEIRIERSTEIVMLAGKSYYMHTVQPGQTLFSICKAYGVKLDEVMALNNKKDASLSPGEVLRIPVVEPFVRLDKKFYYHRMRPKETLYSLSRKFGIKLKRILRDNPEYSEKMPIAEGAVVRLSLKGIDQKALQTELEWEDQQAQLEENKKENLLDEKGQEKVESVEPVKENILQDTTQLNDSERIVIPRQVKLALLLPLHLEGNKLPSMDVLPLDSSKLKKGDERWRLNPKSELFMQFYEGVLLALDSLKTMGYSVDLHVYDTRRDVAVGNRLAGELNMLRPDLIIGPVYADVFKAVAEQLGDKTIPMVFPLSTQLKNLENFQNLIQVNTGEEVLLEDMATWIGQHVNAQEHKLIQIVPEAAFNRRWAGSSFISSVREKMVPGSSPSVVNYYWKSGRNIDSLRVVLDETKENVIFIPTMSEAVISRVLPVLSSLADRYRLRLIGFPDWLKFTSVDEDIYFKLNTRMFANYYSRTESMEVESLASRFRTYFHEEPGNVATRSFDMVMCLVPLVDTYRQSLLQKLPGTKVEGMFTRFNFHRMEGKAGIENRGLYMINYNRSYSIIVTPVQ